MRVFKACILIIRRRILTFAVYFGIFMALSLVMGKTVASEYAGGFSEVKVNFTVINRDKETPLTDEMMDYLKSHGNYVEIEDEKEALQDARFNNAVSYILIIPEGFQESLAGEEPMLLQENCSESSAYGYQMSSYVNRFWNLAHTWMKSGIEESDEKIAAQVSEIVGKEAEVEMKQYNEKLVIPTSYQLQHRVSAYIILIMSLLCVSMVFLCFQRPDIRMRNLCGALKPRDRMLQMTLATSLVGTVFWILLNAAVYMSCFKDMQGTDIKIIGLILLNSFVMLVFAMSLAVLVAQFVKDYNSQGAMANILSLGLSFLGGVFVPVEIMGEQMRSVIRFLPVYWFETGLNRICGLTELNADSLRPVWECMGTLLGFTAAVLCIALAVNRYKSSGEESYWSVHTELKQ